MPQYVTAKFFGQTQLFDDLHIKHEEAVAANPLTRFPGAWILARDFTFTVEDTSCRAFDISFGESGSRHPTCNCKSKTKSFERLIQAQRQPCLH
ncbi:hypothetical protein [Bradyrhizobium retamae]|uniref:Uncharacterized protein n=1 Tax=Bradyrhizobium retamae TaxID=1300035 RepID=A0A0R3MFD1_9BRAD|nr:hypothetical protein [Bradyrhizobium retamae]KRR15814.1 hypothetical protein CQ13_13910 [Bradyrhizobium retamae]